jgi:hypothetical protein
MKVICKRIIVVFFLLGVFLNSGCAPLISRLVSGSNDINIPQIVAHLEPVLTDNTIFISGTILITNPTESVLELEEVALAIIDDRDRVLSESILEWQQLSIGARQELQSPVGIKLDLSILDKEYIEVVLKTGFIYKKLGLRIPIENKVAVLHLNSLRESLKRRLDVSLSTKFYPELTGEVSVKYVLGIINPVNIDLVFEDGMIKIYGEKVEAMMKSFIPSAVFEVGRKTKLGDTIKFEKAFGAKIISSFVRGYPVRVEVSGKLRLADTQIHIPFKIESIQELDFSLFKL